MSRYSFFGPIPGEWTDPQRQGIGWSFDEAAFFFSKDEIWRLLDIANQGRRPDDLHVVHPDPKWLQPHGVEAWWDYSTDFHTPILVAQLLRGDLRAFGDPEKVGAWPEWIPSRVWLDLKPSPSKARLFEGGGAAYWNIRIIPAGMVQAEIDAGDSVEAAIVQQPASKPKGGAPTRPDIYLFVAEMLRLANRPDGLPERSELRAYMRAWADRTLTEPPSDSTIRGWLTKFDYRDGE